MTQVIFDVVDLVGEVHPGDTVSVWPPYVTSTVDGRVKSTRKINVLVDKGPVTEDIEPGPMVVQLQCRGIADTKPRTVTIPDEGTITLANLLQSTFTYTPAVVSQVALDAQRAEDAAVRAETTVGSAEAVIEARDDTVAAVATLGDAQTVLTARDQAVQAAEDVSAAIDARDQAVQAAEDASVAAVAASSSATSAATSETNAKTSETNAKTSETAASSSATSAATSETNAEDAAVRAAASAATVERYSGAGSPEGVVTATAGSNYTDTAATAGAIRWIKTSGTGNTGWRVEYGNTGLRNISDQLPAGATGVMNFQRQNGLCELSFENVTIPADADSFPVTLPNTSPTAQGFKPVSANTFGTTAPQFHQAMLYRGSVHRVFMTLANLRSLRGSVQWLTTDPWPTVLPGTPA